MNQNKIKKSIYLLFALTATWLFLSSFKATMNSSFPPSGYTGASGSNCITCHSGNTLNNNTSITPTGLPTAYTPGQVYTFSITIASSQAGRTKWGFAIKAVNGAGSALGTFSDAGNPNSFVEDDELKHQSAVSAAAVDYTYSNLSWTAPPSGSGTVSFYMAGNAANGSGTGDDYIATAVLTSTVLPIELIGFQGATNNKNIDLTWATAMESKNSHFDVERSKDGVSFEKIAQVQGANNSTTRKDYFLQDKNPLQGAAYYRLKQVDFDDRFTYSKVVVVKNTAQASLQISPNPSTDVVKVKFNNDEFVKIQVINMFGITIFETNESEFSVKGFDAGNYIVRTCDAQGQVVSQKLVVQ